MIPTGVTYWHEITCITFWVGESQGCILLLFQCSSKEGEGVAHTYGASGSLRKTLEVSADELSLVVAVMVVVQLVLGCCRSCSYALSHSLGLSLTDSVPHSLGLSLTHSVPHPLGLSLTHSLTYSLTRSPSHMTFRPGTYHHLLQTGLNNP